MENSVLQLVFIFLVSLGMVCILAGVITTLSILRRHRTHQAHLQYLRLEQSKEHDPDTRETQITRALKAIETSTQERPIVSTMVNMADVEETHRQIQIHRVEKTLQRHNQLLQEFAS